MKSQLRAPTILYKYLGVARTHNFLEKPGISFSSVCLFEDQREGICISHLPDNQTETIIRSYYEKLPYGILCLCENSTSFKMWEKYAENHRGIVVGFNSMHSFFKQDPLEYEWNKVNYTDEVPTLPKCPIQHLTCPPQEYKKKVIDILKEGILRKDTKWSFEEEWRKRGILPQPATWKTFYFPKSEINSIVRSMCMGANISNEDRIICEGFCRRYNIPLFRAVLSDGRVIICTA